jgi:hypothetical protein
MAKAAQKKKTDETNVVSLPGLDAQDERTQWENQQFLKGLREISNLESDMAGKKSDIGAVYRRGEQCGGWTKADFKWAQELEKKDAPKVIATMERRIRIARLLGHGVARQFSMFDEDRTPLDERAYEEGYAAGALRKPMANPYGLESPAGQAYQRGFNDGNAFINKDLASKFGDGDGELIKGDDDSGDASEDEPNHDAFEQEDA